MKKYKEYKDETPERTINLIRSILTDLDLLLLDSNANCDNIFACRVILGNHDLAKLGIGMNGKGSTFEYALASGYAEFMEKIQNRFLCDYIHTFYGTKEFVNTLPPDSMYKKKIHKENVALDFRYDEREEYWTLEKVLTSFGSELMLLYHANNIEELKSILIDVIKIEENHILMIPCFSKRDNDEVFVPIDLILHAIGSNGMTAGNSESEALLHGFCEIFERYALKNIYYGELTPPTIPIDEFSDTPVYEKIKYLIEKKGYDYKKVQIMAPMYAGVNGIDSLNKELQNVFNKKDPEKREIKYFDVIYRENDKVLQLVNMPDENVFNGDLGTIKYIIYANTSKSGKDEIYIDYDGNIVKYLPKDFNKFKHGFVISIHKSQGSEFELVVLPITSSYGRMLSKKLIYTAVTRAKRKLIIVGDPNVFKTSVKNDNEYERKTTLKEKLIFMNNFKK
mgnify:CR=1 FL=1